MSGRFLLLRFIETPVVNANSADPDQMLHSDEAKLTETS